MTFYDELPTSSFEGPTEGDLDVAGLPKKIGRYEIVRELGRGGFGVVYLAHDNELQRQVAVKVPHERLDRMPGALDIWLAEARVVASLDHPHIVPVFDVGTSSDFLAYIVSKWIDGTSLWTAIKRQQLPLSQSLAITMAIAEALHHAHSRGLVHRDVKPSNILLDQQGRAYLNDFGLALRDEDAPIPQDRPLGTLHYMSPEQARHEGHLVDGRADIFSLGVVFYELIAGVRPFRGLTQADVLQALMYQDPRPIRQRNETIPRELERICFRALSKRVSDRYATALDFADDLRQFIEQAGSELNTAPTSTSRSRDLPSDRQVSDARSATLDERLLNVVPKGLRAFDESDSEFFIGLLPGPHDREGLPESLRFWKTRIEESNSRAPLRIAVVYGPSGCGKSSLIRAGLLPRLEPSVQTVVVTATPTGTEACLLDELRPLLSRPADGLLAAMQQLRRGALQQGRRLLIVLDQFEQWFHGNVISVETELIRALRQCDGEHVMCLLIVRDDFWMSVHRLFREFDIRLAERENCAAVDLFAPRHALRVLHAFGHAYGTLPDRMEELTADQRAFLDHAVEELADEDRVICVRLALFAQMVRNRPWAPQTLAAVGGAGGVGVRFLEEVFGASTAPLSYRVHHVRLREILRALLPAPGVEIRACARTAQDLAAAADVKVDSDDFVQILDILENETRLLTPVDSSAAASERLGDDAKMYQLTHDYLVPSIRDWLTRKQKETWRGRCELRLEERAALWSARPEQKQLPSLWETVQLSCGTNRDRWTDAQAQMMRQAQRLHGRRFVLAASILVVALISTWQWDRHNRRVMRLQSVDAGVQRLMVAEVDRMPAMLQELQDSRDLWYDRLRNVADSDQPGPRRLRAELALAPSDTSRLSNLVPLLLDADAATIAAARDWLAATRAPDAAILWDAASRETSAASRLRLAALLAAFDPHNTESWNALASDAVEGLLNAGDAELGPWSDLLRPASLQLDSVLSQKYLESIPNSARRHAAAEAMTQLASTESLCRAILDADAAQLPKFLRAVTPDREVAIESLEPVLHNPGGEVAGADRLKQVSRQRMACVALMLLGRDDLVWPLLSASKDPTLRTELVLSLTSLGVPATMLLKGEETLSDPVARQAIWLAIGGERGDWPATGVQLVVDRLVQRWPQVQYAAERSAMHWLAKQRPEVAAKVLNLSQQPRGKDWFINSQGQVFVEFRGPVEFDMGSSPEEPRRDGNELLHQRRIEHSFAVAVHEVTVDQYRKFRADYGPDPQVGPLPDCPASTLNWFDAVAYCRWLSEQENVPEDQMCYPPVDQIDESIRFTSDLLDRTGYRLPSEAEWEFVCRSGSSSRFFVGEDPRHLDAFTWWLGTSQERTWPVGMLRPNAFGLFDIQGNVHEWCQDAFEDYPSDGIAVTRAAAETRPVEATARVFRGASYRSTERTARSAFRFRYSPAEKVSTVGFRLARTIPQRE